MIEYEKEQLPLKIEEQLFTQNTKVEKKFNFFLGLFSLFNKNKNIKQTIVESSTNNNVIAPQSISPEQKLLENKVDQFLLLQNYNIIYEMLDNGYIPNEKQNNAIQKSIDSLLMHNGDTQANFVKLEGFIKKGITPSIQSLNRFFEVFIMYDRQHLTTDFNLKFFIETDKIIKFTINTYDEDYKNILSTKEHTLPQLTHLLRNHVLTTPVLKNLFHKLTNPFMDANNAPNKNELKRCKGLNIDALQYSLRTQNDRNYMLEQISLEEFMNFFTKYSEIFTNDPFYLKSSCNKAIEKYFKNDMLDMVNATKKIYKSHMIEKITSHNIVQDSYKINVTQIPQEAKILIEEITDIYNNMVDKNVEDFDVTNLFEKRVPEVLKKYLLIDEAYQTTLTNSEGKNAQQLMIESLENIKQSFENKWQEINENALSSLSVTHKYTKNFK